MTDAVESIIINKRVAFLDDLKSSVISFLDSPNKAWFFHQEGFVGEDTFFYYNGYVISCGSYFVPSSAICLADEHSLTTLVKFVESDLTLSDKQFMKKITKVLENYDVVESNEILSKVQSMIERKSLSLVQPPASSKNVAVINKL